MSFLLFQDLILVNVNLWIIEVIVFMGVVKLFIFMIGIGIVWVVIFVMLYVMLVGLLFVEKIGVYMGIFNFIVVVF